MYMYMHIYSRGLLKMYRVHCTSPNTSQIDRIATTFEKSTLNAISIALWVTYGNVRTWQWCMISCMHTFYNRVLNLPLSCDPVDFSLILSLYYMYCLTNVSILKTKCINENFFNFQAYSTVHVHACSYNVHVHQYMYAFQPITKGGDIQTTHNIF